MNKKIFLFAISLSLSLIINGCTTESGSVADDSDPTEQTTDLYPQDTPDTDQILQVSVSHWEDGAADPTFQDYRIGMSLENFMLESETSFDELIFLNGEDGEAYDPQVDMLEPDIMKKIISQDEKTILYIENLTDAPIAYTDASIVSMDLTLPTDYFIDYMDSYPVNTIGDMIQVMGTDFVCSRKADTIFPYYTWTNQYGTAEFGIQETVYEVNLRLAGIDLGSEPDNYEEPDITSEEDFFNYLLNGFVWGDSEQQVNEHIEDLLANGVDVLGIAIDQISCSYSNGRLYWIDYIIDDPCGQTAEAVLLYKISDYLSAPDDGDLYAPFWDEDEMFWWNTGNISVILYQNKIRFTNDGIE